MKEQTISYRRRRALMKIPLVARAKRSYGVDIWKPSQLSDGSWVRNRLSHKGRSKRHH